MRQEGAANAALSFQRSGHALCQQPWDHLHHLSGGLDPGLSVEEPEHLREDAKFMSRIPKLMRLLESQFVRFCVVGASGYAVNLAVYAALLAAGLHYLEAAALSFLVAAGSNYVWNRVWTFEARQTRLIGQGVRALSVSALSLGANQLFLVVFVAAGADRLAAQAVAIVLVTPFSFAANKLWAFADGTQLIPIGPVPVVEREQEV
jgi:putative flippase GtrA